jgi:hypothetical protein
MPSSSYHRFATFDLILIRLTEDLKPASITFSYQIQCSDTSPPLINRTIPDLPVVAVDHSAESLPVRLFDDRFLICRLPALNLSIEIAQPNVFRGVAVLTTTGTQPHSAFQLYFRLVFSCFEIGALLIFRAKSSFRTWTPEQKTVIILLFLAPISNNPLSFCSSASFWATFDIIGSPLFHSYSLFVSLVFFDALLNKNTQMTLASWISNIVLVAPVFLSRLLAGAHSVFEFRNGPAIPPSKIGDWLRTLEFLGYAAFALSSISTGTRLLLSIDITETIKLVLYLGSAMLLVGYAAFVCVWGRNETMVGWVVSFAVHNIFALLMAYLHWPAEKTDEKLWGSRSGRPLGPSDLPNEFVVDLASDTSSYD